MNECMQLCGEKKTNKKITLPVWNLHLTALLSLSPPLSVYTIDNMLALYKCIPLASIVFYGHLSISLKLVALIIGEKHVRLSVVS